MAKIQEFAFTTVKAENFGDDNQVNVTCKTCKATVDIIGSYETILDRRRGWIENHSCGTVDIIITSPDYFEDNVICGYCERLPNTPHKSSCRQ